MPTPTEQYIAYLRLRRCSETTIYGRTRLLDRLARELGCPPEQADADTLADWYAAQPPRMTARSQATLLTSVCAFYRWAHNQGILVADPTVMLPRPRVAPCRPRPIATRDLRMLLAESEGRVRTALVLAAYAGMRACEIAACERRWMHAGQVTITGKGGRVRVVPAHRLVADALAGAAPWAFPYLDARPGPVRPGLVSHVCNQFMHDAGVNDTLHGLRHWHATKLYAQSHDLRLVQDLLGHTSPATTAVYVDVCRAAARPAVEALPDTTTGGEEQ